MLAGAVQRQQQQQQRHQAAASDQLPLMFAAIMAESAFFHRQRLLHKSLMLLHKCSTSTSLAGMLCLLQ